MDSTGDDFATCLAILVHTYLTFLETRGVIISVHNLVPQFTQYFVVGVLYGNSSNKDSPQCPHVFKAFKTEIGSSNFQKQHTSVLLP